MEWYPLLFSPNFINNEYGGNKIKNVLKKNTPYSNIYQSIEISSTGAYVSFIINGYLRNTYLDKAVETFPEEILGIKGREKFIDKFPLQIRFLDIGKDIPPHVIFGEENITGALWYVMENEEGWINLGFKDKNISQESIKDLIQNRLIEKALQPYKSKKHDSFGIKTGTVYQMLSGMLILEIRLNDVLDQDIYDINDNTEKPLKYINPLNNGTKSSIVENLLENDEDIARSKLVKNKYYSVEKIEIKDTFITSSRRDSFDVLVVLEGHSILFHRMGEISLFKGDTLLIPSACGEYTIEGHSLIMDIHA